MQSIAAEAEVATPKVRSILRLAQVRALVPVDNSTLWRWEQRGLFPKRVKIGPQAVGWYADEVAAWSESRRQAAGE